MILAVLLTPPALATDAPARDMIFRLVPLKHWGNSEKYRENALPAGTIYLYKDGSHEPGLIADANEIVRIPQGRWNWIAEAPGYVSVAAGSVNVGEGCKATGKARPYYLWVVPACTLFLDDSSRWNVIQRLDVVSLPFGSVYPLNPGSKRVVQVPAGDFLTYTISNSDLFSIGSPKRCGTREEKRLDFPERSPRDRQAVMAHLLLPEGNEDLDDELAIYMKPPLRSPHMPLTPVATVWSQRRVSVFYPDLPADIEWVLVAEHPLFQTIRKPIERAGGSAQEIPPIALLPRGHVILDVDYRPRQPHRVARIVPYYCGPQRDSIGECLPLENKASVLREGFQEYKIENLDWGLYQFYAEIDDFVIEGLGRGLGKYYRPYLPPGKDSQVPRERFRLWEYRIYGNILLDDEPVEGVVQLKYVGRLRQSLRSETDDDLLYHLYYFGSDPSAYSLSSDEFEAGRPPKDLPQVLPKAYSLSACDAEGFCRYFNVHTQIRGEGRLDLDLGSSTRLEVTVVDAGSREPIPGARVWTKSEEDALVFENGEVTWSEPRGDEGIVVVTDSEGKALFRGLGYGRIPIMVARQGYEKTRDSAWIIPGHSAVELLVEMTKDEFRPGDVRFQLPDGEPIAKGFLLPIKKDGTRDILCHAVTNTMGFARFRPGCLDDGKMILLHELAEITAFDVSLFSAISEITVNRAPQSPLRVRITDSTGVPLPGIPVVLRYPDFELYPNDLLAGGISGAVLFYLTNNRGELILRGVNPEAPVVPSLAFPGEGEVSLLGYQPGEIVNVEVRD